MAGDSDIFTPCNGDGKKYEVIMVAVPSHAQWYTKLKRNSWMQQSDCMWTCLVNQGVVNCWKGALIPVHCLVFQADVPDLQCTSLAVVGVGVNHFCSCPVDVMHLVDCVLC